MNGTTKITDSDLSELLATKVMGWKVSDTAWRDGKGVAIFLNWNPCSDYNHLRQVEEALSDEQRSEYLRILSGNVDLSDEQIVFTRQVLYATARQRCEAIAKVVGGE